MYKRSYLRKVLMSLPMTFGLIGVFVISLPATWGEPGTPASQDGRPGLELTAQLEKHVFLPLEPITVKMTLTNTSRQSIHLPRNYSPYNIYNLRVVDRDGRTVPQTEYSKITVRFEDNRSPVGKWSIKPGRDVHCDLVANLVFDMTASQEYWISVEVKAYDSQRLGYSKPDFTAKSEVMKVRVSVLAPSGIPEEKS